MARKNSIPRVEERLSVGKRSVVTSAGANGQLVTDGGRVLRVLEVIVEAQVQIHPVYPDAHHHVDAPLATENDRELTVVTRGLPTASSLRLPSGVR